MLGLSFGKILVLAVVVTMTVELYVAAPGRCLCAANGTREEADMCARQLYGIDWTRRCGPPCGPDDVAGGVAGR